MGNNQGSLAHHLETASKTGALSFSDKKLENFPDQLSKVSAMLRNLDLSNNKIVNLPATIGSFKCLKTLNLSNNRLSRIPEEIGQLLKLENLILSRNSLSSLPTSVANLKSLRAIDCSKNQLTSFPLGIVNLKHLNTADFSSNKITVIPNGVEDLQVTELNINQNQISSIAVSLAECPKLKTLRIEENCLALNAIPTELLSKSKISSFHWAGNLFDERQLSEIEGYSQYMERYSAVRRKLD